MGHEPTSLEGAELISVRAVWKTRQYRASAASMPDENTAGS